MSRFCQEVMLCAEKGRVRSLVKAVEELTTRRWNEYRAFLQAWGMHKLRPICTNMTRTTIISPTRESQPVSWYHWYLFVSVWFKLLHCCFPGFGKLFVSDSLSAASPNFRAFSFVDLEAQSWSFQPIHAPVCCAAWCSSSDTQHPQLQLQIQSGRAEVLARNWKWPIHVWVASSKGDLTFGCGKSGTIIPLWHSFFVNLVALSALNRCLDVTFCNSCLRRHFRPDGAVRLG